MRHREIGRLRSGLLAAAIGFALVSAGPAQAEGMAREAGMGLLTAATNVVYGPVKVIYGLGGALVAGAAWLVSGGDGEVVEPILTASLRGDYVVTPAHWRREQDLEFIGRRPEDRELRQTAYFE